MTPERRSAPRIDERIAFALSDRGETIQAETKNLSISGVYCLADKFIAPMTKLDVQFELPHRPRPFQIRSSGVVVRVEPVVAENQRGRYHIAIFFSELSNHDREAIAQFIRERLAASDKKR